MKIYKIKRVSAGIGMGLSIIVFIMIGIAYHSYASTDEIEDLFFTANNHYQEQEYDKAIELYEEIVHLGFRSGALYYNIGNAYYKLGKIGKAIVNYERAKKLIPHDEDLFANIKLVETTLQEKQPDDQYAWHEKIIITIRDSISARSWFYFTIGIYLTLFVCVVILIFIPTMRAAGVPLVITLIIVTLLSIIFTCFKINDEETTDIGVIIAEAVDVRYSPSYTGSVAFTVHEGLKARMIRSQDEWVQIRLSKGKSGWIEGSAIEEI
ncbi:MAG: tetratricopeptide repeat protein [Candidatus Omnitrophica bacterium]|nr:tetratricopeptide repeat protein [Candidatus Omnitrophota bacterium]